MRHVGLQLGAGLPQNGNGNNDTRYIYIKGHKYKPQAMVRKCEVP